MIAFSWRGPRTWAMGLSFLVVLGTLGCGGTGTVTGKVMYNGLLLKGGTITFVGSNGNQTISTSIDENGRYTAERVPTGNVVICVDTKSLAASAPKGAKIPTNIAPPAGSEGSGYNPYAGGAGGGGGGGKSYIKIPDFYALPDTSPLTYEVKTGPQEYDITLK